MDNSKYEKTRNLPSRLNYQLQFAHTIDFPMA